MVTFRNNNRRNNFRRNGRSDRNFKNNTERTSKFNPNFSSNENFQRKSPGRNNHNAPKLIEKYNNLAREALSVGDKILSENYFQHADHFTRILNEQESFKKAKISENSSIVNEPNNSSQKKIETSSEDQSNDISDVQSEVN
mgnify:CR=1 FL=1